MDRDHSSPLDQGHGRLERRTSPATTSLPDDRKWPGVKPVCRVVRERTVHGEQATEVAADITSLDHSRANAATLLSLIQGHWVAIENGVHDIRVEAFAGDRRAIKSRHTAAAKRRFVRNCRHLVSIIGVQNSAMAPGGG